MMLKTPPPYPRFPRRPTAAGVAEVFAVQRARDPRGHDLHTALACAHLFCAGWPTTVVDWSGLPLLVCFVVRMGTHHRVLGPLVWDPVARWTLALVAWMALSMAWTPGGLHAWLADGRTLRFALMVPMLFPVLDRRGLLIAALGAGFVCGEVSQAVHAATVWTGHAGAVFHRDPARISGWWDPVVGGSVLCAALGLFLGWMFPASAIGRSTADDGAQADAAGTTRFERPRWLGLVGSALLCLLTAACITLTGTRGAWLGAIGTVVVAATLALVGRAGSIRGLPGRRRTHPVTALVAAAAVGVLVYLAGGAVMQRARAGIAEVREVLQYDYYRSDTGMRLAMWRWAAIEFRAHPVRGVGAGGFKPWAEAEVARFKEQRRAAREAGALPAPTPPPAPSAPLPPLPHAHAHSWPLHTVATLGLVGLGLLVGLLGAALWPLARGRAGPVELALLGLALAGVFDTIHVNQQTANVLFILLGLSVWRGDLPLSTLRALRETG